MKKFSLLFAMLTMMVSGAWATQVTSVKTTADDATTLYYYTFTCCNAGSNKGKVWADTDGSISTCSSATATKFIFQESGTEGAYYIKSVESGKYLYRASDTSGAAVSLSDTKQLWYVVVSTGTDNYASTVRISYDATSAVGVNCADTGAKLYNAVQSANGNSWWIMDETEAKAAGSAYFNFSSSDVTEGETSAEKTNNGVTATVATSYASGLGSGTSTYTLADEKITSLNENIKATVFSNDDAKSYISAGSKDQTSKLTITISGLTASKSYNISLVTGLDKEGAGSWNTITSDNTVGSSNPAMGAQSIAAAALTPYIMTGVVADEEGKIVLYVNNTNGSHTAVINCLGIYQNANADYSAMNASLALANKYTIGSGLGEYVETTPGTLASAIETAEAFDQDTQTAASYQTEIDAATKALDDAIDGLTINLPKAGDYIRIKGTSNTNYISNEETATGSKYSRTTDSDASIFYFDGTNLKSMATSKYMATTSTQWAWSDKSGASTIEFGSTVIGKYYIKCSDVHLYDGDTNVDRGKNVDPTSASTNSRYVSWNLELASVTANMYISYDLKCATFVAPFQVEIPEYVTAYTTEDAGTWVKLNKIEESAIPAATPVVLVADDDLFEGVFDFKEEISNVPTSTEEYPTNGVLTGNLGESKFNIAESTETASNYVLQNQTDGTGWYRVETNDIFCGVNRCYMTMKASDARKFVPMSVDTPTGISNVATEAATKADGKYLVNGRVLVVKAGKAYNLNGQIVK